MNIVSYKQIRLEIIIVSLLWVSVIASYILMPEYNVQFVFGVAGLLIVSVTLKKFYKFSLQLLLLLLALSIFSLVRFSIAFGVRFLDLDLASIFLLCLLIIKRFDRIQSFIQPLESDDDQKEKNKKASIEFFKKQFSNLSILQMEEKLQNKDLVDEAKQALKLLINEKKNKG